MTSHTSPAASDEHWMRQAILEARYCFDSSASTLQTPKPDVPVGAVCVFEGRIIGRGHNKREADADPTAHAELLAIQAAARHLQSWRLTGVTLYVTLEPCPMCAGAVWLSRLTRLVYGAREPKSGACGSLFDIVRDPRLNHRPQVKSGVLESECAALLEAFFAARRA